MDGDFCDNCLEAGCDESLSRGCSAPVGDEAELTTGCHVLVAPAFTMDGPYSDAWTGRTMTVTGISGREAELDNYVWMNTRRLSVTTSLSEA
jgi:hypothetical protein